MKLLKGRLKDLLVDWLECGRGDGYGYGIGYGNWLGLGSGYGIGREYQDGDKKYWPKVGCTIVEE